MRVSWFPFYLLFLLGLLTAGCARRTVPFSSRADAPGATLAAGDTLTTTSRRGVKLTTAGRKMVLTKAEERAAKEADRAAQRKKARVRKNVFLGERIKRAFVKSGPNGRKRIIEVFYYLRTFQQPNPLAPARYYFSPKKKRIFLATAELDPATDRVLHGPYKKMQNNLVLETGYYALGVKHLRWEKFDGKGALLSKTHFELGFPRDANLSYYDAAQTMLNEVVPYVNGKLDGDYVKYRNDGQREWTGKFENGRRVGEWTSYWGQKNRRHHVYQYGESGYEPEEEPELVREYTAGGTLIFDKEKNLDRRGQPDPAAAAPTADPRRPGNRALSPTRPPLRKPTDRRPGYKPKVAVPPADLPPAVPAAPGG